MTLYVSQDSSAYSKLGVHRMFADTEDELHRAAAGLGVALKVYDSLNGFYILNHRQRFHAILKEKAVRLSSDQATAMLTLRASFGMLPPLEAAIAYIEASRPKG